MPCRSWPIPNLPASDHAMQLERLVTATLLAISTGAQAASFDCSHARDSVEKAICGDSRLGQIDQEISETYFKIDASLDSRFRDRFHRVQRAWSKERIGATDLKTFMTERLAALKNAVVTVNSVTLLQLAGMSRPSYILTQLPGSINYNKWVDQIWSESASDHLDDERIAKCDALSNSPDRNPNGAIQKQIDENCDGLGTTTRSYEINMLSPDLISVHESTSNDGWHAVHPSNDDVQHNCWLSKSGRIKSDEMFSTHGYIKVIKQYVKQHQIDDYGKEATAPNIITKPAFDPRN